LAQKLFAERSLKEAIGSRYGLKIVQHARGGSASPSSESDTAIFCTLCRIGHIQDAILVDTLFSVFKYDEIRPRGLGESSSEADETVSLDWALRV
jgi:hypothetical protein